MSGLPPLGQAILGAVCVAIGAVNIAQAVRRLRPCEDCEPDEDAVLETVEGVASASAEMNGVNVSRETSDEVVDLSE